MSRSSRAALLVPVVVLMLFVAGCAERGTPPAASPGGPPRARAATAQEVARLRAAGTVAAQARSARFEATLRLEVPDPAGVPGAAPVVVRIVTTGSFAGDRLELSTDLAGMLTSVDPSAPLPPGFDEPLRTILDGATAYLRVPPLDELLRTDRWLSAAADDLVALEEAADLPIGPGLGGVDPVALLASLREASDVRRVGEEALDGRPADRLRAALDVGAAFDDVGPVVLPVDVWVDDAGLVHRLQIDLTSAPALLGRIGELVSAASGGGVAGSATMTLTFTDHGDAIEIAPPRPDDVVPVAEALASVAAVLDGAGRGAR